MKKHGMNKKQAEKILATVVMGMNLVNTVAPLTLALQKLPANQPLQTPVRSEAEPLDYAILPQLADAVDNLVFAKAYATDYSGTAHVSVMVDGDTQTITAGQSCTVDLISAATGGVTDTSQNISSGGAGTIITMEDGYQNIYSGGTGMVSTMEYGGQNISAGGAGTVDTMENGWQGIEGGGTGTINTMNDGDQIITSGVGTVSTMISGEQNVIGGTGTVSTMNSGYQYVSGGTGTVSTMNSGEQNIYSGGSGIVDTMSDGYQNIENGGTGTISTMSGGSQRVNGGGTGMVSTMINGNQSVNINGTGTIDIMSGGMQSVVQNANGIINTMSNGNQKIIAGTGTVSTMISGEQNILGGGTGTISTMSGGKQMIANGGSGTVSTMEYGSQTISSGGTGTVSAMSDFGGQYISSGGTGMVSAMIGGEQNISSGATGMISMMDYGYQTIDSGNGTINVNIAGEQDIYGGTGTISTMEDGYQYVYGGTGIISAMSGGSQNISSGGTGTINMMQGGTQTVDSGGIALDTVIAGGTQTVNSGAVVSGATLSAGIQQVYDGTNLNNITFAGGTQAVMSGAAVSGMQVAAGQQRVENGGTAINTEIGTGGSLQLSSGGIISSLTLTSGSLELENINGGSFTVSGTLTANNATVDMTDSSIKRAVPSVAYESLTIDKLSGSGTTFIMDTDLSGETNSDKITITDADAGTHYVQIKDLSQLNDIEVTGAHQQILITDNSGKLNFEGKEFNAGGLWDVDPTLAKQGNDWYLTKLEKKANNDTRVLLDAADNSYALWRNTNDSLRSRLSALASGSEQSDGIWARTQAGRFSGDNYEGRYNLYQLGFDQAADAKSVYGAAVDYGDGNGSYDNGSGKDKLKSFSLYGVWTGANGAYTNVTARYGMVSTDLESYGDYPDKAEYKQHAYSVSVEYGKRFELEKGFFIEPNAQFTLGRLGSIDYTTDRGANGYIEGMNSAIGRIGFVMGQKITGDSDIYLKADLLHEFAGERDLQLTSDAGGTSDMLTKHNDYGDTWFELGLGANIKVSKTASIYGEIERGFGGDINKKWSVNGGVRFTF
ncbi:autotransporter outer membrane beta-barrel domain-containing protein [Phascolarctobacterium faecium]|uniref:autotransporter outer membrane beta-barrel domain-containing protein n=1 Tax=Phascolarctobacterium faecium TaxID=33025 RepID=UPI003AB26032